MADEDNKTRLIQIQVLAKVTTDTAEQASVLGGNLARQIQANIPSQYEVVGVELQSTSPEDVKPYGKKAVEDKDKVLKT